MKIELLPKSKCLNFVEFNITGDNDNYHKCDEESLYLNSDIFNLFTHCFENSNKLYEYFGETRYNSKNIIPLQKELQDNMEKLISIDTLKKFEQYIKEIFLGENVILKIQKRDKNWKDKWEKYHNQIIKVNDDILTLIDKCLQEDRILWVVGF
ncbi:MAG: hypothetical protein JXB17_12225 [Bacteroidales bacterium]|nr:hypothetical protein [Bacteroidales bacterium]